MVDIFLSGCTEKKIWLLFRHGTRFPGKKISARMIRTLPTFQQKIVEHYNMNKSMVPAEAVHNLVNWRLSILMDHHTKLTVEGERELVDLAERFQSRFPILLSEIYGNYSYKVICGSRNIFQFWLLHLDEFILMFYFIIVQAHSNPANRRKCAVFHTRFVWSPWLAASLVSSGWKGRCCTSSTYPIPRHGHCVWNNNGLG